MLQDFLRIFFRQFIITVRKHREAIDLTYKYRLWSGFWRYGWVAKAMVIIGAVVGLKFLSIYLSWLKETDSSNPMSMISSMGALIHDYASEGYHFLFLGGMKYIMIILLEVVIFHVCRRTLTLLTGRDNGEISFDAFVHAQVRMIKVVIRSWVMESIAVWLVKLFFSHYGLLGFLQPALVFGIQCYYVGFAVLDNYNEQFGLSIKESAAYARGFAGVVLAVGAILQLTLSIPLAGPVAGPFLASVAATLAMFELSDLHRRQRRTGFPTKGLQDIV